MRHDSPLLPSLFLAISWLAICLTPNFARGEEEPAPGVHPSSAALKKELTGIVETQLAAFRANDYAKAYVFAASELKAIFSVQDFEEMVKTSYPIIAQSSEVEFGTVFDRDGEEAVVNALVKNTADKRSAQYRYTFRKEEGGWRITGVTEIKPDGLIV
jgi:hypothetical protein